MKPKIHIRSCNIPQLFFIDKLLELIDKETVDTYRARVMNPKTIVMECCELIKERLRGRIPSNKSMKYAVEEAQSLLSLDKKNFLRFSPFSHHYILSTIGKLYHDPHEEKGQKDNSPKLTTEDLKKILITLKNFAVNNNNDYAAVLFIEAKRLIRAYDHTKDVNDNLSLLNDLSDVTTYLATELLNMGFSKNFLFRRIGIIFSNRGGANFYEAFNKLSKILDYPTSTYKVIFKLDIDKTLVESLQEFPGAKIVDDLDDILDIVLPQAASFKRKTKDTHFYIFELQARDNYDALNKARVKFAETLDLIYLGFYEHRFEITKKIAVINEDSKGEKYVTIRDFEYELDGVYIDGSDLYRSFAKGINSISENENIKPDTKEKIRSAIRYLRLGNNAIEVEHKFINYWIALEYLFSDTITENQDSTIVKIKRVFPKIHSIIFIKRLLRDYHDNITHLGISDTLPDFNQDNYISYLKKKETYDWISNNLSDKNPLLVMRGLKLRDILFPPAPIDEKSKSPAENRILKHKKDLELHLARMYRIRNSIVHDAAIGQNIVSITANLKYYLIFIIAYAIKGLEENKSLRSIEDYFALQENIFDSLEKEKFPTEKMLEMITYFELII